ncbi:hypothetical protein AGMMS49579_13530 [Spirochaetia bacterium]|nr:hypothetical protein AGMMS49579_13530 [Spirochaetia bacterium]
MARVSFSRLKAMMEPWYPEIQGEERERQVELHNAVQKLDKDEVQSCLDKGTDPDRCLGGEGWKSNNPIRLLNRKFYRTYGRLKRGEEISDPAPDVATLQALVEGGADINREPYVWQRVFLWNKTDTDNILKQPIRAHYDIPKPTQEEAEAEAVSYIKDANRILEALLRAGANPDKLGHPVPYTPSEESNFITDEEAAVFFAQGTRPINEAIKKGMVWESQVDLLLQYTKLDEASLEAARESNDPGMVDKITKLWNEM